MGRVIGKGGAHIREIQQVSGARVFLPKDCVPGTNYREMLVSGTRQQLVTCQEMVQDKMRAPGQPISPLHVTPLPRRNHNAAAVAAANQYASQYATAAAAVPAAAMQPQHYLMAAGSYPGAYVPYMMGMPAYAPMEVQPTYVPGSPMLGGGMPYAAAALSAAPAGVQPAAPASAAAEPYQSAQASSTMVITEDQMNHLIQVGGINRARMQSGAHIDMSAPHAGTSTKEKEKEDKNE